VVLGGGCFKILVGGRGRVGWVSELAMLDLRPHIARQLGGDAGVDALLRGHEGLVGGVDQFQGRRRGDSEDETATPSMPPEPLQCVIAWSRWVHTWWYASASGVA
jgi:hypothetical protein